MSGATDTAGAASLSSYGTRELSFMTELHDAFVSMACGLICWRRLKKHRS
jgi:hypothetical protein